MLESVTFEVFERFLRSAENLAPRNSTNVVLPSLESSDRMTFALKNFGSWVLPTDPRGSIHENIGLDDNFQSWGSLSKRTQASLNKLISELSVQYADFEINYAVRSGNWIEVQVKMKPV